MITIDRHEYSRYDVILEEHRNYVKYDKQTEEITFTLDQLKDLLHATYDDGVLRH